MKKHITLALGAFLVAPVWGADSDVSAPAVISGCVTPAAQLDDAPRDGGEARSPNKLNAAALAALNGNAVKGVGLKPSRSEKTHQSERSAGTAFGLGLEVMRMLDGMKSPTGVWQSGKELLRILDTPAFDALPAECSRELSSWHEAQFSNIDAFASLVGFVYQSRSLLEEERVEKLGADKNAFQVCKESARNALLMVMGLQQVKRDGQYAYVPKLYEVRPANTKWQKFFSSVTGCFPEDVKFPAKLAPIKQVYDLNILFQDSQRSSEEVQSVASGSAVLDIVPPPANHPTQQEQLLQLQQDVNDAWLKRFERTFLYDSKALNDYSKFLALIDYKYSSLSGLDFARAVSTWSTVQPDLRAMKNWLECKDDPNVTVIGNSPIMSLINVLALPEDAAAARWATYVANNTKQESLEKKNKGFFDSFFSAFRNLFDNHKKEASPRGKLWAVEIEAVLARIKEVERDLSNSKKS